MTRPQRGLVLQTATVLVSGVLLAGCWHSTSSTAIRDGRTWTETRVVGEETDARIEADADETDDGWEARFEVEIADTCVEELFVEQQTVETTIRRVDSNSAIPIFAGILTAIAVPVATLYVLENGDPINQEPVATQDALIFLGVGSGVAGGLLGAGAITVGVSREGAGSHEKILSSRRELRGQVDAPAPCRWRALEEGTLVLTPDNGRSLDADVVRGVAVVPLPKPSAKAPLSWDVELEGVGERVRLDLSRGEYADRSHLARVGMHLDAGQLGQALEHLGDVRPRARGRDAMTGRLTGMLEDEVRSHLAARRPREALALLDRAGSLEPGGDPLLEETLAAAAESQLADGEVAAGVATAGRLVDRVGPKAPEVAVLREAVEAGFGGLLSTRSFDEAETAASRAEPLMGSGWALGASERATAGRTVTALTMLLAGDAPSGKTIEVPASAVASLADVVDQLRATRGDREALYPPGSVLPEQAISDAAAGLIARSGFEARFAGASTVADDPDGSWLDAAETFLERFPAHPAGKALKAAVPKARASREKSRRLQSDFDSFSDGFARAAAQNFLASRSGIVDAISPGSTACREGRDFLKNHGPSTYRRMAGAFCKARFPSSWIYAEGRRNEVADEVPVRACDAFFKAPRGCGR
jgi:hypothetical protein